jgi:hypothetical protein
MRDEGWRRGERAGEGRRRQERAKQGEEGGKS